MSGDDRMRRSSVPQKMSANRTFLIAAAAAVLLFLLFTTSPFSGHANKNRFKYSVMIDAGSTGSRVHVYKFEVVGDKLVLKSEVFQQLKPGLSSYKDNPTSGGSSLEPLLDASVRSVPAEQHSETPVNLKATAGLRLLKPEQAEALLKACDAVIAKYPFYVDKADVVGIMGGLDEGLFGWVTVNYLRNTLTEPAHRTSVILDLGGGSTQIALAVPADSPYAASLTVSEVMGARHNMYVYSHLGLGLMAGRAGVLGHRLDAQAKERTGAKEFLHACIAPQASVLYEYGSEKLAVKGGTTTSAAACLEHCREMMKSPSSSFQKAGKQPSPEAGQPVVAMSYYVDRAMDVGLMQPDAISMHLKPQEFRSVATDVCGLSLDEIVSKYSRVEKANAPYLCLDLCFIISLLEDGFGLTPSTPLFLAKKIEFNGEQVETAWALGAALEEISETAKQIAAMQ